MSRGKTETIWRWLILCLSWEEELEIQPRNVYPSLLDHKSPGALMEANAQNAYEESV